MTLFEVGELLCGRFRIFEYRGRGVAGETYRCFDVESEAVVALKVALSEGEAGFRDFIAQYRKLLRIYSAGVARVLGFFRHETRACLALEWIEGKDLAAWAAEHDLNQRLLALAQISRAVRDLHREGLSHGDLRDGVNVIAAEQRGCVLIDPEPEIWGKTSGNFERQGDEEAIASVIELLAPELARNSFSPLVAKLKARPPQVSIDVVVAELASVANRPPMVIGDSATIRAAGASVRQSGQEIAARYVRNREQRQAAIDRLAAECAELAAMFGLEFNQSVLDPSQETRFDGEIKGNFLARSLQFSGPFGSWIIFFDGAQYFPKPVPYPPRTIALGGWRVEGARVTSGKIRLEVADSGEPMMLVTGALEPDTLYEEPVEPTEADFQVQDSRWSLERISDLTGHPIEMDVL